LSTAWVGDSFLEDFVFINSSLVNDGMRFHSSSFCSNVFPAKHQSFMDMRLLTQNYTKLRQKRMHLLVLDSLLDKPDEIFLGFVESIDGSCV